MNTIIIGTHQTYLKTYAGGYVRLREFIKNFPKDFDYKVIDVFPSIYEDIVEKNKLVLINSPKIINFFLSVFFPLGVLCERVWMSFAIYLESRKYIKKEGSLIYVPIGELPHLYIPGLYLKKNFPNTKLVVDILNFRVIDEGFVKLARNLKKTSTIFMSISLAIVYYSMYVLLKKTINEADYIFTVSKDLIKEIKKIYPKNTIDYTPSGVDANPPIPSSVRKKFLGVYVGRVTEQKGIYNLINIWKEVVKVNPEAKLAVAGFIDSDISATITDLIKKSKLEKNITIFGSVTESEKYKIICKSKIFLHMANYEPLFPVIGILEGLICGLPCIVFDMTVLKDEVTDKVKNNFVFVVQNGNIKEAAKLIISFDRYTKLKKNSISKMAKKFAGRFNWSEIASKEFFVINDLTKEK